MPPKKITTNKNTTTTKTSGASKLKESKPTGSVKMPPKKISVNKKTASGASKPSNSKQSTKEAKPTEPVKEPLDGVTCSLRDMANVLEDKNNKIKDTKKWILLVDSTGQAATFLRYRDVNYACALNAHDIESETIRRQLIGSIRFGKPYVIDIMDSDLMNAVEDSINKVQPNLYQDLMSKSLLENEKYIELVLPTDDESYQAANFDFTRMVDFTFIVLTTKKEPPEQLLKQFYTVRVQ